MIYSYNVGAPVVLYGPARRGRIMKVEGNMVSVRLDNGEEIEVDYRQGNVDRDGRFWADAQADQAKRDAWADATDQQRADVEAIKAHALDNYDKDGWDTVVECYDSWELLDVLIKLGSLEAAIADLGAGAAIYDEQRRAVQNEIF